jgi:hypothetical protein
MTQKTDCESYRLVFLQTVVFMFGFASFVLYWLLDIWGANNPSNLMYLWFSLLLLFYLESQAK